MVQTSDCDAARCFKTTAMATPARKSSDQPEKRKDAEHSTNSEAANASGGRDASFVHVEERKAAQNVEDHNAVDADAARRRAGPQLSR